MDIERFRLSQPSPVARRPEPPKARQSPGLFIKGPIPMAWIGKAAKLEGKTLHVGLELWRESGCRKGCRVVRLSTQKLKQFGVGRQAGYAALSRLEAAKLVTVERRSGRLPLVTILKVEDDDWDQPEGPQSSC